MQRTEGRCEIALIVISSRKKVFLQERGSRRNVRIHLWRVMREE